MQSISVFLYKTKKLLTSGEKMPMSAGLMGFATGCITITAPSFIIAGYVWQMLGTDWLFYLPLSLSSLEKAHPE